MASLGPSDPDSPPVFAAALQEPRLPSYSRSSPLRAEPTQIEHTYTLNSSKGAPWLIVNLKSYASSAQSLPLYHDGNLGVLEGELSINSSDLGKIKSVTAVLCGERTVVGQDQSPSFLDMRKELWNASASTSNGPWPFRFELPDEIQVKEYGVERERFKLPLSFSVKGVPSLIEYKLSIEVKRGRFRLNSQLDTIFTYIPRAFSPKYSPAQLQALTRGGELPVPTTPLSDADWNIGKGIAFRGKLFQTRSTVINISIAVPAGSTLAVGTLSPALIILESEDEQTLDLFSTPSSIRLRLVQEAYIGTDNDRHSSHNTFITSLGRARVWPTSHDRHSLPPNTRFVEAELVIPRSARPSFEFARFEVKYRIQLIFNAAGFVWDDAVSLPSGKTKPKLEMDLTLVSDPGSNVAWKSRVPQAYAGQDLKDEDFYDGQNITGVLLGAGQKYLEHHHS